MLNCSALRMNYDYKCSSTNIVNMVRPHEIMHEEQHRVLTLAVGSPNSKSTTPKIP